MKHVIRIGISLSALFVILLGVPAVPMVMTGPPHTICGLLAYDHAIFVKDKDYVSAGVNSQAYAAHGCYNAPQLSIIPVSPPKTCKVGIKNIAAFLNECPAADNVYGLILQDTPVSFDYTEVDPLTLATDVVAVCKNKTTLPQNGGPTLRQREEFRVVQALRTIYYMDGQGDTGCVYPWTGGRSFYKWMISLEGGVNIRDDTNLSQCCDPPVAGGTKPQIAIAMPNPANEPNLDISPDNYTWLGILGTISIIGHETRHEPIPPSLSASYMHVGCCPAGANACDQAYDTTNLPTYGLEYWMYQAAISGEVNVGYGCMPDANTNQTLVVIANGFLTRFCTMPPPTVSLPAKPGGTCPP